jgi:hypothetical protein
MVEHQGAFYSACIDMQSDVQHREKHRHRAFAFRIEKQQSMLRLFSFLKLVDARRLDSKANSILCYYSLLADRHLKGGRLFQLPTAGSDLRRYVTNSEHEVSKIHNHLHLLLFAKIQCQILNLHYTFFLLPSIHTKFLQY